MVRKSLTSRCMQAHCHGVTSASGFPHLRFFARCGIWIVESLDCHCQLMFYHFKSVTPSFNLYWPHNFFFSKKSCWILQTIHFQCHHAFCKIWCSVSHIQSYNDVTHPLLGVNTESVAHPLFSNWLTLWDYLPLRYKNLFEKKIDTFWTDLYNVVNSSITKIYWTSLIYSNPRPSNAC